MRIAGIRKQDARSFLILYEGGGWNREKENKMIFLSFLHFIMFSLCMNIIIFWFHRIFISKAIKVL